MNITLSSLPIAYTNVDAQTERNASFLDTMSSLGYSDISRYSLVSKDHKETVRTTIDILSEMKASGKAPFIIFGDGVKEFNYINTISVPDDADCVYLAVQGSIGDLAVTPVNGFPGVYRTRKPTGMQAIVYVTNRFIDASIEKYTAHLATLEDPSVTDSVDNQVVDYPRAEQFNVYAITPIFYQHEPENPIESNLTRITNLETMAVDPISFN